MAMVKDLSLEAIYQRFCKYATHYFSGFMSVESFQHVADELLYESFQEDVVLSPLLFAALKCASDPPSTPKKLALWHRKLKRYGEKLNMKDFSGIIS